MISEQFVSFRRQLRYECHLLLSREKVPDFASHKKIEATNELQQIYTNSFFRVLIHMHRNRKASAAGSYLISRSSSKN
jgi:hypothetical protein